MSCTLGARCFRKPAYRDRVAPPDPLESEPFGFVTRADGSVVILYRGAPVTLLRGKAAVKFATRLEGADAGAAQQLMARATGNFKRPRR